MTTEMKNLSKLLSYIISALTLLCVIAIAYISILYGHDLSYTMLYEDNVKRTIIDLVDPAYLK